MIAVPPLRAAVLSPKAWPYLLLARFSADKAAPLGSPLAVDVGSLVVTDTGNRLSASGGRLALSGAGVNGDPSVWGSAALARAAGRAVLARLTPSVNNASGLQIGWDSDQTGAANVASLSFNSDNSLRADCFPGGTFVGATGVYAYAGGTAYDCGVVWRSDGNFFALARVAGAGPWTLAYVGRGNTGISSAYPSGRYISATGTGSLDDFRVVDLGGAWASDFGQATSRLAGARSAGDSTPHTPNCLLEFTVTTLPSVGSIQVAFRQQDTSNEWYLDISSTGAIVLNEYVAASATSRGSSTGVANGNRVVVIADGTTIKVYVADTSKISYASASNFATATTAQVVTLGTGGAVSDLVAWPRTISLPSGV